MGQYYKIVNVDKKEFIQPANVKLMEFGDSGYGAMFWLSLMTMTNPKKYKESIESISSNGGFLNLDSIIKHGAGTRGLIGSWAGDRIVIAGDYAERGDACETDDLPTIIDEDGDTRKLNLYDMCGDYYKKQGVVPFKDITKKVEDVAYNHPYVLAVNVLDMLGGYDWRGGTAKRLVKMGMPQSLVDGLQAVAKDIREKAQNEESMHDFIESQTIPYVGRECIENHQAISGETTAAFVNVTKGEIIRAVEFGGAANYAGATVRNGFTTALAVLLANSNGRGGGDFHGERDETVGTWAGDQIKYVDDYKAEEYHGLKNVSQLVLHDLLSSEWVAKDFAERGITEAKI